MFFPLTCPVFSRSINGNRTVITLSRCNNYFPSDRKILVRSIYRGGMERNRKLKISRKIYIVIVEYFSTEKGEVSIDFELFSLNFVELLRDEYEWKQIERTFSRFRATAPLPIRTVMRRNSSFHPPFSFLSSPRVHRSALPFSISCKRSRDLSYFLTPGGLDLGLLPRGSINQ